MLTKEKVHQTCHDSLSALNEFSDDINGYWEHLGFDADGITEVAIGAARRVMADLDLDVSELDDDVQMKIDELIKVLAGCIGAGINLGVYLDRATRAPRDD